MVKPLAIYLFFYFYLFIVVNGVLTTNTIFCALLGGSKPNRGCELTILRMPGLCELECKMLFLSDLHPPVVWFLAHLIRICVQEIKSEGLHNEVSQILNGYKQVKTM
jgi:hypothetical protein